MKSSYNPKVVAQVVLVVMVAFFMSGCMGFAPLPRPAENKPADVKETEPKSRETTAVYYDFEDVLIPNELKIVKGRTVVVSTPGFTSGILALKGLVERTSLFNFFNANMLKDNWSVVSQIKSPGTTIMVFQKASRCAVITIRDEQFMTWVEIGVAPTLIDGSQNSGFIETTIEE